MSGVLIEYGKSATEGMLKKPERPAILRGVVGLILVLCINLRAVGQQRFHVESFEGDQLGWAPMFHPVSDPSRTRIVQHRREKDDWNRQGRLEILRLKTVESNQRMSLQYPLPPARPFDELKLTLRVKSNQEGLRLAARVVFMDHANPRTGRPLTAEIRGSTYRSGGEWQELVCKLDGQAVELALQELRTRTRLPLNKPGHTYVDTATLLCDLNPGTAEIALDDLKFGPIVAPSRTIEPAGSASATLVDDSSVRPRVDMRSGRLRVDGRAFFPRIAAFHDGDTVTSLKQAGINTVLLEDASNQQLMAELKQAGIYAVAVPPMPPATAKGTRLVASSRALFPTGNSDVLFWYLGTRIRPEKQTELVAWSRWLRTSDPLRRPLMADITGSERMYSRHVNLLGLSQPVLGTSISIRDYRDTLLQRRALAQPGMFTWTWIQADTPAAQTDRSGNPYVVEPEQIRLQTYAALSAGSKAIGYWKKTPLDGSRPGDVERKLMMHQLNLEMSVIEDWLAEGQLIGNVTCEAGANLQRRTGGPAAKRAHFDFQDRKTTRRTNVDAAVFKTSKGTLVLPVWYSQSAQFVPSEMVAENLSLVVQVPDAVRAAWLVTTTGVRPLSAEIQAGGLRVDLWTADRRTYLDQTAIVVVTEREDVLAELRTRVAAIAEDSAITAIQMAEAKRDRVLSVESQIAAYDGRTQGIINDVNRAISSASSSLASANFHSARRQADHAMRLLRRLQSVRWKATVQSISTPVSSQHTISYQTLPDHFNMMQHLQSARPVKVAHLLPAVRGGDANSLQNKGWRPSVSSSESVLPRAQFNKAGDRYSLALEARPVDSNDVPEIVARPPIRATSPIVQLSAGEIAYVTGRVRIPRSIIGNVNGAMLFDSFSGPAGALRWRQQTGGWVKFDMLREARADGPFFLTAVLSGLGRMEIADLEVVVYPPSSSGGGQVGQ